MYNKKTLIWILMVVFIATAVIAPPRNYIGTVYEDYAPMLDSKNLSVWGNCFGTGQQYLTSTMTFSGTGTYSLNIPMDEITAGDQGCDLTDKINFTIIFNLTYQPVPGVWVVGDQPFDGQMVDLYYLTPFNLTSPADGTLTTDNTPTFTWTHGNATAWTYNLIIYSQAGTLVVNSTGIDTHSYTLNSTEAISSDGTFNWRVDRIYNGHFDNSSEYRSFDLDTTPASISSVTPPNESWVTTPSQTLSVTTNENGYCKFDMTAGVAYNSKTYTMSGSGTSHTYSISLPSQGNNSYYIQCNDTLGNTMPLANEWEEQIRLDDLSPSTSGATVLLNGGDTYTNSSSVILSWSGFADQLCPTNCSGISVYHFNSINNYGSATSSAGSPEIVTLADGGSVSAYVWADDVAGNIGGPVSDSITVDTTPPTFSNWGYSPNLINSSLTGGITLTVDVTDAVTGLAPYLPMLKYKRGSYDSSFNSYANMTLVSGDSYSFTVPEPSSGSWAAITDQNLRYQVYAKDLLNNSAESTEQTLNITNENYAPVWVQPSDQTIDEDSPFSLIISAFDQDSDTLTFTANDSDVTITSLNRTSATVTWTPTNDDVGTRNIIFTVSDGSLTVDSSPVSMTVSNVNDAPTITTILPQTGYEYEKFSLPVTATDVDVGDTLIYSDNSELFDIENTTGYINFTPLQSARGTHDITITVTDGTVSVNTNFTLTIYYCGDNVCNLAESCSVCSADCGNCGDTTTDRLAIHIRYRNCLAEEFPVKVYQLYNRATCKTMGEIINGYEVCGNLSDTSVSIFLENPGSWENEDDKWNLTGEYVTDEFGEIDFTPVKTGRYKIFAKKSGFPDAIKYAYVKQCYEEEEVNETKAPDVDLKPLEPKTEEKKPEEPTVEEPTIITEEESSFMLFVIYYILVPIILLSMFSAGSYYYHVNKDSSKQLLIMRIWLKKRSKLIKLYLEYWYHEIKGKIKGGK